MPNIDLESVEPMNILAKKYPGICYSMMAIHPCDVKADFKKDLEFVDKELSTGKYIAVGETGIDLDGNRVIVNF